ncbi:nuclear transport factor 2 family protein [Desulfopila sp. IMCC35008]|uniref:nuclear transport factor 2 family protein n=1 Tax=Desulfopila sp. IMCC35008 TaxID=2653858 RepID=UPI0013D80EC0|nr:nuclear transport factor 2 family protein [Desulfopila sp. IMCC35008]
MEQFLKVYQELTAENLHLLKDIYSTDVRFIDPAHEINGLSQLTEYFAELYQNVESIEFTFHDVLQHDESCYLQWVMSFRHKSLAGGKTIHVPGTTYLRLNTDRKICHHRDYFDLGMMLYEHLPLLGRLLIRIKRRLGK